MKKVLSLIVLMLATVISYAQVSVTATAGTVGPTTYTTLNSAFTAINAGTHQGVISISITANTTEPATPVSLLKSGTPSNYTSISIKPVGDRIINSAAAPSANRGIIELFGADNVTIDGDDPATAGTRNLSIIAAPVATAGVCCIRLGSTSTVGADGANNNIIKNCIIMGSRNSSTSTVATYGIAVSSNSTTSVTTGGYSNLNNLFENNIIKRCHRAIYSVGVSATYPNTGMVIRNNTIGSSTTSENVGLNAIYVTYSSNTVDANSLLIEGNDVMIGEPTSGISTTISAIDLGTVNAGARIRKNNIHDVISPSTGIWGVYGINISGVFAGLVIENNFIRDIVCYRNSATLTTAYAACGIRFTSGATGVKINHNTIALNVPTTAGATANYANHGIYFASTATVSELRNNIILNNNVGTGTMGIYSGGTGNFATAIVSNNNYSVPNGNVGYYSAATQTTLSSWQTATGKDAGSTNGNPGFVSSTDFHINVNGAGAANVSDLGTPIVSITTDYDGDVRSASTPDIGADEFALPPCNGIPTPGNTIASVASICPNVAFTLSLQNPTSGAGVTYQWQSADDAGFMQNVQNIGTSPTLTTTQTTPKFYRCEVTCAGNGSDISFPVLVNLESYVNCYCTPIGNCSLGDLIASVTLNTLSNVTSTTCVGSYVNYTTSTNPNHTTTLLPSSTYNCIVGSGAYSQDYAAWIDYNDDGVFSTSERIGFTSTTLAANSTASFPITLACTPPAGPHRLRVRSAYATAGSAITPCNTQSYGETEDYLITIASPAPCPDLGALSVTSTTYNTASLSWALNCSNATSWDIQYGPTGFALGTGTILQNVTATTTYTVTGLSSSTAYQFYIRANCGASGVSNWSLVAAGTTTAAPCAGQPNAGVASAPTSICASAPIALSATGITADIGITYQWELSTDNINWTPISGATTVSYNYTTGITTNTWFRLVTTCTLSSQSNTSNASLVTMNLFYNCYASSTATSAGDEDIFGVTLNGSANLSNCTSVGPGPGSVMGLYSNYRTNGALTSMDQGGTYTLSLDLGTCAGNYGRAAKIWIDYNRDGVFSDPGEMVYSTGDIASTTANPTNHIANIVVPVTANVGLTGMRVSYFETTASSITPTLSSGYGEVEDYLVNITPLVPVVSNVSPLIACSSVGTIVITGTGLFGATAVSVGGTPVTSYVVNSPTQITAIVGAGTSGTVSVVNNGMTATSASSVTITTSPAAPSVSPSSPTVQPGQTATLTASGSEIIFDWYTTATGGTSINTGATFTTPALCASTTYYVEQNNGSCPSVRTPVTVNVPLIDLTTIPSNALICGVGGSVTLNTPSIAGATYLWSTSDITPSITVSPSVSTAYTVTITASTCTYTFTKSVGVLSGVALAPSASSTSFCYPAQDTVRLNSNLSAGNFGVASITYAAATAPPTATTICANGIANVPLTGGSLDDGGWSNIPIGFSYNFFGSNYSTISAGTNGLLMFGTPSGYSTSAGQLGQYNFNVTNGLVFPNVNNPGNVIALMAADQYFGSGTAASATSVLKYWNDGIAPTRRFIIEYSNVNSCCGSANPTFTAQAILYETTGIVEVHIFNKNNSAASTVGLQDATKTIGACPPGRQAFTALISTPEAWRFIPPANYTYAWSTPNSNVTPVSSTATSFKATVTSPGTYTYNLSVTNPLTGCVSTSPLSFTAAETPTASITASSNVTCFGGFDGTATVSALGGTAPYTYSWSPSGGIAASATGLSAGTYTVTVSDATLCSVTSTVTITQPSIITPVVSTSTAVTCNGGSNGSATISATGGVGPYTYNWAPVGGSSASATGLSAGIYTVTVTDASLCSQTITVNITQPLAMVASISTLTNVSCFGGSNGTITASVSGGTSPYTYSWSPSGGSAATASGLFAGTYTVTITDANLCIATTVATVIAPSALAFSINTVTNNNCYGGTSGSITTTVSGGTSPYSYSWSPSGGSSATGSNLLAGTYTVTITDANLCSATTFATVSAPSIITATTSAVTNVSCNGGSNGSASLIVSGGVSPYTYSWSPIGGSSSSASGLSATTYTVTITDANLCSITKTVKINEPAVLAANISSFTNVACFGENNGEATVFVSGGTTPYTYAWSPSGGTSATASSLIASTYTVTITDANLCTVSSSVVISEPALLTASVNTSTNVSCNGGNNGSATVSVNGGTAGYLYSWSPSGGSAATASGLSAGTYTVLVIDANLCMTNATVTITQPSVLNVAVSSSTNVSCLGNSDGAALATASGGIAPYNYSWSPSGGSNATANNLSTGTYTITVSDANNCTATSTVTLTSPSLLTASISSLTNVSCNGGNTGSATINVTGGTASYSYSWAPSGGTSATANGLTVGSYTVTVTDANNCTATTSVTISEPSSLVASVTSTSNVSCFNGNNGSATVLGNGGVTSYNYTWAPFGGNLATASGLTAGTYTVTITDANSCTATTQVTINEPALLVANVTSSTNVSCYNANDGIATASASGGVGAYTYSWAPFGGSAATASGLSAGSYTVTISDANACSSTSIVVITQPALLESAISSSSDVSCYNGANGAASVNAVGGTMPYSYSWLPSGGNASAATGLIAGSYTVVVTDAHACSTSTNIIINQPTLLTATLSSSTNVSCNGGNNGSLTVSASGGITAYNYSWLPYGGNATTANGLSAGTYTVTVTDANGCSITTLGTVTQLSSVTATISSFSNVLCNGGNTGSASVTANGGAGNYTYTWFPSGGTSSVANGLAAGTYTVTVTDANSCTTSTVVTISEPSAISATIANFNNVTCYGESNGDATVVASGGTSTYNYSWSPSGGTSATETGLVAGIYNVIVSDVNGCATTVVATISQPDLLVASISSFTNVTCNGLNNGTATVNVVGGTASYSYTWLPYGGTSASASGLGIGTYTILVSDANGCNTSVSVTITEPTSLSASIVSNISVTCYGGNNGALSVSASGGTTPYSYSWSPSGGSLATTNGVSAGTYAVTVTDANGCTITTGGTILEPSQFTATISAASNVLCFGGSNGSATVSVNGGTPSYSYSWLPSGGSLATANGLVAGTYTVNVSDAYACSTQTTISITEPTVLTISASAVPAVCNGSNGSLVFSASGGAGSASFKVNGTTQTSPYVALAGNYTIVATDANGCTKSTVISISQPSSVVLSVSAGNALCNGGNGNISFSATGGTGVISYTVNGTTQSSPYSTLPGTYTVVATDVNGCTSQSVVTITQPSSINISGIANNPLVNGGNGSLIFNATGGTGVMSYKVNGVTQSSPYAAPAGTYTIVATDANNCSASTVLTISQPTALTFNTSVVNATCFGTNGTLTFSAVGGAGTISYKVNGVTAISPYSASAGTYTVTATDANNASVTTLMTITQPTAIVVTRSITNALCYGATGSLTFNATGGTGAKTFTVNGNSATSPLVVSAGSYTIIATDANGCTNSTTAVITEPVSSVTVSVAGSNNPTCVTTGFVAVTSSGGTGTKTYTMLPISGTQSPAGTFTGLVAGTYTIVATDANGCSATTSIALTNPSAPSLSVGSITPIACNGGNTSVSVSASGGSGPYLYNINGSSYSGTNVFPNLVAGTYNISAKDANNCTVLTVVTISQPSAVTLFGSSTPSICNGGNGQLSFAAFGGTGSLTYKVNGVSATSPYTGVAGTYTIVATDVNNCSGSTIMTITQPSVVSVSLASSPIACIGGNSTLTAVGAGGNGIHFYSLDGINFQSSGVFTNKPAGTYTVTCKDGNNCSVTSSIVITQPTQVSLTLSAPSILCNGTQVNITASATGGTGSFTYTLNGGASQSSNLFSVGVGNYTVVAADANNCSASSSLSLTQPNAIILTASSSNAICNGANGSLIFSAVGGTGTITYKVNGVNQASPFATIAGTYTVVATDANACTQSTVLVISQPSAISFVTNVNNAICNGVNGSFTFSATGGTGTMSYTVNGVTQSSPYSAPAGTYTVVATDANACTSSTVVVITQPSAVVMTANATNALCNGINGSLTFSATGGTGTISYKVNGTTQSSPFATAAGTYTVVATDANLCSTSTVLTITQPSAVVLTANATNALCNGINGSLTFSATGGTGTISYKVNGTTQSSPFATAAGTYTVVATDANLCSTSTVLTITQPSAVVLTANATNALCNGVNGSLTFSATGGTGTITYKVNGTTQTSPFATAAGTYTVLATDANLCSTSTVLTITQPTAVVLTANATNALCNGVNGSLSFSATGGTGTITYKVNGTTQTSPFATAAGTYTVVATDANLCSTSTVLTITQPSAVVLTANATNALCNGVNGSLTFSATGGTGAITYKVNGTTQTSPFATAAGTYTVVATDANLCSTSTVLTITQPSAVVLTANATNALCNGVNGSLTFSATGGTGAISYTINGTAQTSPFATTAGTYTVVATDANLCSTSTVLTITQPSAVVLTANATNALCNGVNGSLTFSATGGTGTITYKVNGTAQTSPFATAAGTYTVVATDANLCSTSTVLTITQPSAVVLTANATNALCNGVNGSLTFSATGGTGAISYKINGTAQTSPFATAAGTYTVVATDANLCSTSTVLTITQPSAVVLTANATNALCNGINGSLTFSATGGTGTISYTVNGNTQSSPFATAAGTYTVVATDANLCSTSTVLTITQPSAVVLTANATNALCNGVNGSLSFSATGGTGAISYKINGTAQTSPFATAAGTYTVVATDANLCSTSTVLTITQPSAVVLTANATNALCNGVNGSLSFSATGGTGAISYKINGTAQTSPFATAAGTYTVVATDANLCSTSTVLTITQPSAVVLTANATNALCNGVNGSLTFSATGGTGAISYTVNGTVQTSPFATAAGTYTVVATDANLCSTSTVLTITQPSAVVLTANATNALCNGVNGSLTFSATGGTGSISYKVNGTTQTSPYSTAAGTYTVVATDANNCSTSTLVTITQPNAITFTTSTTSPLCLGGTGSLTFGATGGTGTITYKVNGTSASSPYSTIAGTYTVVATDANACTSSTIITLTQPTLVVLSASASNALCTGSNGSLTFNATGGTGAMTYTVNGTTQTSPFAAPAGTYTIVASDANACSTQTVLIITQPATLVSLSLINSANPTCNLNGVAVVAGSGGTGSISYSISPNVGIQVVPGTFSSLTAGSYTITATDVNGCTSTVTLSMVLPPAPVITVNSTTSILCNGGTSTITVSGSGGLAPYTYSFNGNPYSSNTTFANNPAGVYNVTIKDANACTMLTSVTITQPALLTATASASAIACNGGTSTITTTAVGGTQPYTYSLNGGTAQASSSFSGVTPGIYTIVVSDVNACSTQTLLLVTQPNAVTLTASYGSLNCNGSTTTVLASGAGGTGTLQYSLNGGTPQASNVFNGVGAGTYTLTASDANSCSASTVFTLSQPNAISLSATATNALCNGSNGSLTFSATGGTGTLTYVVNGATQASPYTAAAGTYTVVVTDANLCNASTVVTITQPSSVVLTASATNALCNGSNGSLTFSATGGTGAINYTVNGTSQSSPYTAAAGSYTVVATDANNCSTSTVLVITQPSPVVLNASAQNPVCNGNNGSLSFSATGGTGSISYTVNGTSQSSPYSTAAGTYTVIATDANNCSTSTVVTITQPSAVVLSVNNTPIACNNGTSTITASATGGNGLLFYSLDGINFQSSGTFSNQTAGTYTITAKDGANCSTSTVLTITQPTQVVLSATATNALCNGANGSLTFSATGGTGFIAYTVNGVAQSSPMATGAGTYTVVAADANNCSVSTVLTISQPSQVVLSATATNALCNATNGSLTFSATGGTGVINYTVNGFGQTSPFATGAGTYTVAAVDANACSVSTVLTIAEPTQVVLTASATNALCNAINGSLTFSATGGTGVINYTVNGIGQTSPFATGAGTYTVAAVDANACSVSTVLTITEPTAINLTASSTNALCNGSNGSLTFGATGGTGTINYTVNGTAQTSPMTTGAGTYTVVAADANNCSVSTVITITQPTTVVLTASATNALCNAINGSLTFSATGGTGTINYTVNGTAQTSPFATGAGTYTVVASDANNCSTSTVLTITEPTQVVLTASSTNALCNAINGSLTFSATGGTGTIGYTVNGTAQTSPYATLAGTYTVVAADANNCSVSTVLTITEPTQVVLTASSTNALCNGSNGSLTFGAVGGTGTINYTVNGTAQTSPMTTGAGTYTVVAADANNCSVSTVLTITEPTTVVLTASATNALCNAINGSLTFGATGGTGTINYTVNGTAQTSPFATGAGTYTVVASDANNCSTSTVLTITEPTALNLTANATNALCNGINGSLTFGATGGTGTIGYTVNGTAQTSPYATLAGTYTVVAADANACSVSTVLTITEPSALVLSATTTAALCNGLNGSLTFSATGGTGIVNYTVNGTAQTSPYSTAAGTYTVMATDANACSVSTVLTITQPATLTMGTPNITAQGCYGISNGAFDITSNGGTLPYTYTTAPTTLTQATTGSFTSVTNGVTYTVTLTDANGCSATTSLLLGTPNPVVLASGPPPICEGTSGNIAALSIPAGVMTYSWQPGNINGSNPSVGPLTTTTYTVTGTDINGCIGTATITVDVLPAPVILTANPPAVCSGNSAAIAALSIPTLPSTSFVWEPGTLAGASQNVTPAVTTVYTVMATDVNGCTSTTSITVAVNPLPIVGTSVTPSQAVCAGTSVTMSGNGALTYSWSGASSITDNVAFTSAVADAGTYTVTGTDINGCTSTATTTFTVYNQPTVVASFTPANVCTNSISVPNATGAVSYVWSGGLSNGQPIVVTTGLSTYTVTGTDAQGCSATATANVIGNVGSGSVATNNTNATMNQGDDLNAIYYDPSCNLVAGIDDGLGGNVLGVTSVNLNVEPTVGMYNGQPFLRRWYQITPTSNGPANVTLYVTQADFDNYNANVVAPYLTLPTGPSDATGIANLRITKNDNTGFGNNPIVITPTVSWNGSYWTLSFTTPGFSQFHIHSVNPNNVPLPATVTSFTGRKLTTTNELNWLTSSEQNNSHFMLQYSTDGVQFADLAKVDSKAPNGNSQSMLSYSYEHTTPALGHNYYRLKQVDIDGNSSFHAKVIDLQWGANGSTVTIYPNPTQGMVNIDVYATRNELTAVKVLDMSGRVVKQVLAQSEVGMNKLTIDLGDVAQGLYTIQVYENDQLTHVERVRKSE